MNLVVCSATIDSKSNELEKPENCMKNAAFLGIFSNPTIV
jgi:hypothetical protein